MTHDARLLFRPATAADADSVAALHADSWRRHYRGAYADAYLDGDVLAERTAVWRARLKDSGDAAVTTIVESDGALVGFVHTRLGVHPTWGALLDNLHVTHTLQRRGIGAQLVAHAATAVLERTPGSALHLWVLEQNVRAQAFYAALGGEQVERTESDAPSGDPANLNGSPMKIRVVWRDPRTLLRETESTT